jgi:hypothetical protein
MNRITRRLARGSLCGLVFLSMLSLAESADDPSIERMKKDLYFLASEECEGRGVETEGINKAANYIADQFRKIGLKAPKGDDNYFQPFAIKGAPKMSSPNSFVLRGPGIKSLEPEVTKAYSITGLTGTGKVSSGVVFAGYGITTNDKKYDDYAGLDVKGKTVVVLRKSPRSEVKEKDKGFPEGDAHSSLSSKIQNAEAHGAAAVLFINDKAAAGKLDSLMAFDYARGDGGEIPILHLKRDLLDQMLVSEKKRIAEIEAKIDEDLKPQSFELKDWKVELETTVTRPEIKVKNVIGVLEGKGPLANETVIIGSHYDHLGRGERGSLTKGNKDIHYGADDNASGTTGMMELARRLAADKERQGRRIVFMAFSGEERGLLGSRHYVKEPIFPLSDTVLMINLDMIGRAQEDKDSKKEKLEIGGVGTAKGFRELLDTLNKKYDFAMKKTDTGVGPSDHASFYPKKIPVFFYFTGTHPDYHRPTDTPDRINYTAMKKIVDMAEEIAQQFRSAKDRPEYVAGQTQAFDRGGRGGPRISLRFMPGEYDDDETRGVPVGSVTEGGPGDKAGLKAGDWIVEVGGKPVKNMTGYMTAIQTAKPGEELEIIVTREGKKVTLKVKPE